MVAIRAVQQDDHKAWLLLWDAYLAFYNETLAADVTQSLWDRFFDSNSSINACIAEENGVLLGFATFVLHEATWTTSPVCYLEDLYVSENARGKGIGQELIQNLINVGEDQRWSRVYWHTNDDNKVARKLYDKFLPADHYVRYRISLDQD